MRNHNCKQQLLRDHKRKNNDNRDIVIICVKNSDNAVNMCKKRENEWWQYSQNMILSVNRDIEYIVTMR
jgi:hypothetical protein